MTNALIMETLARQHQQELLDRAALSRLAGIRRSVRSPWWTLTWRVRAGRVLIRTGQWLAPAP